MPLTAEGTIIVNRVLASCYPSSNHDLAHIGMTLIRWFPELIQWIFGHGDGISIYVRSNEELGKWMALDQLI